VYRHVFYVEMFERAELAQVVEALCREFLEGEFAKRPQRSKGAEVGAFEVCDFKGSERGVGLERGEIRDKQTDEFERGERGSVLEERKVVEGLVAKGEVLEVGWPGDGCERVGRDVCEGEVPEGREFFEFAKRVDGDTVELKGVQRGEFGERIEVVKRVAV